MNITMHLRKTTTATLGLTLLLQTGLSWADDTEMYFGQLPADVKPNVFFILDDSGSMRWCLDKQNIVCPNDSNRMGVLQKTMNNLIKDTTGVNIGLMTLSRRQSLEVKDIDKANQRGLATQRVSAMTSSGSTPIAKALYDAARYFNGFPGKHNSFEAIRTTVESPITHECQQTSHFVLLTDGQANGYNDTVRTNIQSLTGESCPNRTGTNGDRNGEACSIELASWMHENDQSPKPNVDDIKQTITTHTIGFALDAMGAQSQPVKDYLSNLAKAGGGEHYLAENASALTDAFNSIIRQATEIQNTSFVNPSPAGGDYNSDEHKKQVYYPMFQPVKHDPWPGNLKRYALDDNYIERDQQGKAVKDANNEFKSDAISFWSDSADGNNVSEGGAAHKLPAPNSRNLWTFIYGEMVEFPTTATLNNANSKITETLLDAKNKEERRKLLRYIRGFEDNGITPRRALGDPLHSAPTLFSYECQGTFSAGKCNESADHENTTQMAIIGTNEGFIHMFNTDKDKGGVEQFAFMPEELLKNIKPIYEDSKTDPKITTRKPHRYGMDNTVTVWLNDKDNNGKVDRDDKVYAYATMRRGGKSIYALDITDKNKPKLVWKISAGDTHFEQLGQTWSVPVKTKIIDTDGNTQDVLIFGGGYDEVYDNPGNYKVPASQGNDIYIVNAETGKFLWSASSSGFNMQYSIPSNIRVLSLDDKGNERTDGLATQFFVGDVGGQIWRFIMDNGELKTIKGGGENNSGVLAKLGSPDAGHGESARRFYHGPDVATEGKKLYVNIGSGYRAHPLDTNVHDRMYSLHVDLTDNGETLTEAQLSPQIAGKFNGEQTSADIKKGQRGWFIELQGLGEKIISTPKTVKGRVIFNTYTPPKASDNPCAVGRSENRTYDLRVEDATPSSVAKGTKGDYSGYSILSKSQGALGDPNVICFEGKCRVQFGRGEFSDPFSRQAGLGRKTYWIDLAQ